MKQILFFGFALWSIFLNAQTIVPTFANTWEDGILNQNASNHWRFSETSGAYSYTVISTGARVGTYCSRVEVRPGDNPLAPSSPGTERSEVYGPLSAPGSTIYENESSGIVQYAWSTKFDATWTNYTSSDFAIIFQVKAPAEALASNPIISFSATDSIRVKVRCGDLNNGSIPRLTYSLSDGTLNKGNWIDFKVTVDYKKSAIGSIKIERRNEGSPSYTTVLFVQNIQTLAYNSNVNSGGVGDHYVKFGLYRNAQSFTSILYNDNFTRSIYYVDPPSTGSAGHTFKDNGKTIMEKGKLIKY